MTIFVWSITELSDSHDCHFFFSFVDGHVFISLGMLRAPEKQKSPALHRTGTEVSLLSTDRKMLETHSIDAYLTESRFAL